MIKYLAKASNEELSFCRCTDALAATPGQLDCPWCGCGWMISCSSCHKAFVYARVVEVDGAYEDLVSAGLRASGRDPTEGRVRELADWLRSALSDFKVGDVIVYLDGWYLRLDRTNVEVDGIFARHKLDRLPHAKALDEPGSLRKVLGERSYWIDREHPTGHERD